MLLKASVSFSFVFLGERSSRGEFSSSNFILYSESRKCYHRFICTRRLSCWFWLFVLIVRRKLNKKNRNVCKFNCYFYHSNCHFHCYISSIPSPLCSSNCEFQLMFGMHECILWMQIRLSVQQWNQHVIECMRKLRMHCRPLTMSSSQFDSATFDFW